MSDALPPFDLDAYLPYRFTVIAAEMSQGLARTYRERFGLSIAEWRVLVNVGYAAGLSVRDVETRVSLERSKVSRAATRLEERGLLAKEAATGDRRLLKLRLTPAGERLLAELIPLAERYQAELLARLGPDHSEALHAALDRLTEDGA